MTAAAITTILATPAAGADERVTMTHPKWVPPLIRRLAVCESHGDPRHHVFNSEGEFGGIVSWAITTWQLDRYPGMPRVPYRATLRQQVRVAIRSVNRGRTFGCLRHLWVRYG